MVEPWRDCTDLYLSPYRNTTVSRVPVNVSSVGSQGFEVRLKKPALVVLSHCQDAVVEMSKAVDESYRSRVPVSDDIVVR